MLRNGFLFLDCKCTSEVAPQILTPEKHETLKQALFYHFAENLDFAENNAHKLCCCSIQSYFFLLLLLVCSKDNKTFDTIYFPKLFVSTNHITCL